MDNESNTLVLTRKKGVLDYGDIVKMIRAKTQVTQQELIEMSGISGPTIRKVEKCEGGKIHTLFAILDAMDVEISFTKKIKPDEEESAKTN